MNFNSSIESYDSWQNDSAYYSTFSDLQLTATNGSFPTASGVNGWTREVGELEGISGHSFFIGAIGANDRWDVQRKNDCRLESGGRPLS